MVATTNEAIDEMTIVLTFKCNCGYQADLRDKQCL
jgi:hypothetical protein